MTPDESEVWRDGGPVFVPEPAPPAHTPNPWFRGLSIADLTRQELAELRR